MPARFPGDGSRFDASKPTARPVKSPGLPSTGSSASALDGRICTGKDGRTASQLPEGASRWTMTRSALSSRSSRSGISMANRSIPPSMSSRRLHKRVPLKNTEATLGVSVVGGVLAMSSSSAAGTLPAGRSVVRKSRPHSTRSTTSRSPSTRPRSVSARRRSTPPSKRPTTRAAMSGALASTRNGPPIRSAPCHSAGSVTTMTGGAPVRGTRCTLPGASKAIRRRPASPGRAAGESPSRPIQDASASVGPTTR